MEPRPTAATPAPRPAKGPRGPPESDSDEHQDVEIELELPQYKIDELLAQLQDQDSSLKSEFPLAHVATVAALAPVRASVRGAPHGVRSSLSQALGDSTALRVADEWDPLAKLAQFKELQARYAAVKEQRERAESTKRILQQMPTAGATPPPAPAMATGVADPQITPPEFPPAGGLPFPFCGVPGVLSPRTKAPPEPERDLTDGAYVYDAVREIAREEGPEVYTRMSKEEVLLAKDGMDMTLNHLRTTGARMRTEVRELDRKMEEAGQMAQIRQMASNEPELQDELMAQQRLIHEQQRLADEARLELEMEKERAFWLRREKVLQPEEVDDFHLEGDPVPYPADEDEVIAASRATGNRYPAMRHMTPELAPEGTGPRSRYRMELPASREYHNRVAHQAASLGWPSPAEALAIADVPSPKGKASSRSP
ncbi:Peroxisomal membrane protein PMP34, partial [Durusdinium trenchii]